MTAWAFEALHCPTLPNEIKKTKLQTYSSPQAGINILCVPSMARLNFRREFSWIIQGVQVSDVHSIDAHSKLQGCVE